VIRAITWFCPSHCGAYLPGGQSWSRKSPLTTSSEEMLAFIGRPLKYFSRMTRESRSCVAAANLALQACGWKETESREIGLVAAGYEGCLAADQEYFGDYIASGRTLGRGNLFIYTLPSSTMGEVAIALGLRGPTLHIHDASHPAAGLAQQARHLVNDGEAEAILGLWSDRQSAVCFAIEGGAESGGLGEFDWDKGPAEMAQALATMVQPT
jgi:3-oxoacyl-(acyl-carrier-protein) synthase